MRFLFIGSGYPGIDHASTGSGIGTYLKNLTTELVARGHTCHVLLWSNDGCYHEIKKDGMSFYLVPHQYWPLVERVWPDSRDMWNLLVIAWRLNLRFQYDAIEIQSEEGIANWVLSVFPGKTILRVHTTLRLMMASKGIPSDETSDHRIQRENRSMSIARVVLTHSNRHGVELERQYPKANKPKIVYHGVPQPIGTTKTYEAKTVLIVGSIDRRKGMDRLRPVMQALAERRIACKFVIVSRASEQEKAKYSLADPLPDGITIQWRCNLSDVELDDYYLSSAVLLHLARYESFGLPLVEAAAAGLPVVTTRVGIAEELLTDELEECLVDGDDPIAVAEVVRRAMARRHSLSEMMLQVYEERFSVKAMVDAWLNVVDGR